MLFQGWDHIPLANIWVVSAEASCWGPPAPEKLASWSSVTTSEEGLPWLMDDGHLQLLTRWLKAFYQWEQAAFQVVCAQWLNVYSFHEFLSTPAGTVAVASPIPPPPYISVSYPWFTVMAFLEYRIDQRISANICLWQWDLTVRTWINITHCPYVKQFWGKRTFMLLW